MLDVIEVEIASPHHVRVVARCKDGREAEAVIKMAVFRRGVETHFFTTCPAGTHNDGDTLPQHGAT